MTPSVENGREFSGRPRRRFVRLTAAGVTAGVAIAAMVTAGGGSAGAATPISQSEGRFLTGTAGGQSFDSVAAINGEMAQYPSNAGPNQNNLSGSVLGQALSSPLGNVSIPSPGGVTFGAVGQYAQANKDGSAAASSGLIGSNGAINVGGSGNGGTAMINIADLPGASTLTDLLGNLTLTVGAVSAQAKQAAFGKKLADPSANCTGGTYSRVSNPDQAGSYQFANLTLTATSTLLSTLGSTLDGLLGTAITGFSTAANALGGVGSPVVITGTPTATSLEHDFTVSLAGGGVMADLTTGSLTIDLAKILTAAGLDINNLCPNTSLVSYLAAALAGLPAAIDTVITGLASQLSTALGNVAITVGGVSLSQLPLTQLPALISSVTTPLTNNLPSTNTLNSALQPALNVISNNLLDLTANAQSETGSTFTEAALILKLVPNGGSLPTLPTVLPSFRRALAKATAKAKSAAKSSASASASTHSFRSAKLVSARLAAPLQAAPAGTPVLQLNLALAAVTNTEPAATAPTSTTSPSSSAAGSELPTGVPAGAAGHRGGGSPALPIVLVLIGLVLAGGGVTAYRGRGKFSH